MDPRHHPPIPKDLLEHLEKAYPERSPTVDETEAKLRFRGGQTSVVRALRAVFEEQNKAVLANNP